jgi:acetyl-CoA carboxylase biotin carboxyl carrier protein
LDIQELRQLLDLVKEHDLAEFEVEHNGLRLRVRKNGAGAPVVTLAATAAPSVSGAPAVALPPAPAGPVVAAGGLASPSEVTAEADVELAVVKSPIVGTFYRAAEPSASAFVEVGSTVKKGDVLCIIEAMKLMNEIDSEYDGEVTNIYVENGQPVQYGERLFAIRTR